MKRTTKGFTIVELLAVIAVIGILASIALVSVSKWRERTYETRANADLTAIANATKLYVNKYNAYPPEVVRDIPTEIKEFTSGNVADEEWPNAPWPDSVFDYENWDLDQDGTTETVQISIRFCPLSGDLSACKFPDKPWAENFNANSAYYYCLTGYCRPHQTAAVTNPGYCINCPGNTAIKKPGE